MPHFKNTYEVGWPPELIRSFCAYHLAAMGSCPKRNIKAFSKLYLNGPFGLPLKKDTA